MIGKEQIENMKKSAYLINASRGGLVDEKALREALIDGKLAGAALDVYEQEPPTDTSLTRLLNVVSTPHIGSSTLEAQKANSTIVAEKIIKFFQTSINRRNSL
jgi:D-3-phosphoglycerate dehydrogenase